MGETPTVEEIVARLRSLERPGALEGMARFGIATEDALGVSIPDLRALAKSLGRDHALALWRTLLRETRILATLLADPCQMTGGAAGAAAGCAATWARKRAFLGVSLIAEMRVLRVCF
jgi:3-methyladenine DNA glycosylase AlkD